ncbi:MAG: hypothetical protein NTU89_00295 [Candidatus Dependentiae bacterium]|nr:hypothetical protein [Candidatus Dependentiae bacterium]
MNYTKINNLNNLEEILNQDILITGDLKQQKEEIYYNTYELSFDKDFIKTLSLKDLHNFILKLIKKRTDQVILTNNGPATFYLWHDEQYLTLCFDVLSGADIKLPFGFKLNFLETPLSILKKFHNAAYDDTNYLTWENLTILNPGDPGFDDDDEYDNSKYVLDVYVITLPQSTLSTLLKSFVS